MFFGVITIMHNAREGFNDRAAEINFDIDSDSLYNDISRWAKQSRHDQDNDPHEPTHSNSCAVKGMTSR
jgi:hypothetical protein